MEESPEGTDMTEAWTFCKAMIQAVRFTGDEKP